MTRAIPSTCRRRNIIKHPTNKRGHPLSRSACNGQRHRPLTSQQARTTTMVDATNGLICSHGHRRGGRVSMETNEGERCRKRTIPGRGNRRHRACTAAKPEALEPGTYGKTGRRCETPLQDEASREAGTPPQYSRTREGTRRCYESVGTKLTSRHYRASMKRHAAARKLE